VPCAVRFSSFLDLHGATLTQNGHGWQLGYKVAIYEYGERIPDLVDVVLHVLFAEVMLTEAKLRLAIYLVRSLLPLARLRHGI
jgi:hypothetical protein